MKDIDLLINCVTSLTTLEKLDLSNSSYSSKIELTNKHLEELVGLTNLTLLNLYYHKGIDDEGLLLLSSLKNLTTLNLYGCKNITIPRVNKLLETNPQLQVLLHSENSSGSPKLTLMHYDDTLKGFKFLERSHKAIEEGNMLLLKGSEYTAPDGLDLFP